MSELKPCPFCGSKANLSRTVPNMVLCSNENCWFYNNFVGILTWNTRPIEDALRARIAELEADIKDQRWDFVATMENVNKRYIAEGCKVEKLQKECDDKKARIGELETYAKKLLADETRIWVCSECGFEGSWRYQGKEMLSDEIETMDCPCCEKGALRPKALVLQERIAELEQSDHWTFISEKPPEKDGSYLCTMIDTKGCKWVDIRTYSVSYGWFTFGERVVCWMPKPTVPTDLSGSSASESRCDNS